MVHETTEPTDQLKQPVKSVIFAFPANYYAVKKFLLIKRAT